MLAPLSKLAFFIGAWLVLEWISISSEFAGGGFAVEVGLDCWGLACIGIESKSAEFAGVGSAVEVGLYYWGLACIRMDF